MNKFLLTLLVVITSILNSNAQRIEMEKGLIGHSYYQNNVYLTMNDLFSRMEFNSEAYQLIKSAKSNKILSHIFGGAGVFLICWPLGTEIANGEPNWSIAIVGTVLVFISVPFYAKSTQKAKNAVDIYNAGLPQSYRYKLKPQFRLTVNRNGIGLSMCF